MTDDNCFQSALRFDPLDRGVVEQRKTVPKDVAVRCFDKNRPLADGEFGRGGD